MSMPWITKIVGIILIALGVYSYTNATPDAEGKVSPTALIPAFLGAALAICGVLAHSTGLRKHVMHVAAMLGLVGFLGGFMPLIRQASKGKDFDPTAPAALSGIIMVVTCLVFVGLCVKSFIDARKARDRATAAAAATGTAV